MGGAQAIAALAYGTRSIPRVDKIFGPGNRFVTAAKRIVSADCAIDLLAGPTEAMVFAEQGNARFIAADLIAQAEHDPDAISIFVTTSAAFGRSVAAEIERQLARTSKNKSRAAVAGKKWRRADREESGGRYRIRKSVRAGASEPARVARTACLRKSTRPEAFFSATGARRLSAITRAARTTCCRRAAWPQRAAGFPWRIL